MLKGKNPTELAITLKAQNESKKDFIIPTSFLTFTVADNLIRLMNRNSGKSLSLTDHAHGQMAAYTGIPVQYYRKMVAEAPALLCQNANEWLSRTAPDSRRMIRTLDGRIRAIMSDRYLCIDNWPVANTLLPLVEQMHGQIVSSDVTSNRMYIKTVFPRLSAEVAKGDVVRGGVIIKNSEVGMGVVELAFFLERLVCTNGLTVAEKIGNLRRAHLGRRASDADITLGGFYSHQTARLEVATFLSKAQDIFRGLATHETFNRVLGNIRSAQEQKVADPATLIEDITERYNLTEDEGKTILDSYIRQGDLSRWGMVNAITETAHTLPGIDYDRSSELEEIGGRVLIG